MRIEEVAGRVQTLQLEVVRFTRIELLRRGRVIAATTTDADGRFQFAGKHTWGTGYLIRLESTDYAARMPLDIDGDRASSLEVLATKREDANSDTPTIRDGRLLR